MDFLGDKTASYYCHENAGLEHCIPVSCAHLSVDVEPHSCTWVFTSANFQFANIAKLVMECLAGDN